MAAGRWWRARLEREPGTRKSPKGLTTRSATQGSAAEKKGGDRSVMSIRRLEPWRVRALSNRNSGVGEEADDGRCFDFERIAEGGRSGVRRVREVDGWMG